jgi:hypothetical protein
MLEHGSHRHATLDGLKIDPFRHFGSQAAEGRLRSCSRLCSSSSSMFK